MSNAATKSVALWVVRVLRKAGFEALFAGGCVRDMLLGQRCTDYDVATSATPEQVRRLFRHVLLVGAKFGVAMIIVNRRRVEATTFRCDVSYSDGRRPDHVKFTTAREDALRRDFTINGMFFDPLSGEVIDYVGGQDDLRAGIVRTIGNPQDRFNEDYLRMIRAVRFEVRLGFEMERATAAAIRENAGKIVGISGERIFDELQKMLRRDSAARALERLDELGLAGQIVPELAADRDVWARAVRRVGAVARRKDLLLTLGAWLCELPVPAIHRIVRRWGGSNEIRDGIGWIAQHLGDWRSAGGLSLAQFKRLMANWNFERLRALWRLEEQRQSGGAALSRRIAGRAAGMAADRIAPAPFVTGADLKQMGLHEGPRLGGLLKALYDAQLNEQVTTRKEAMKLAAEMIGDDSKAE